MDTPDNSYLYSVDNHNVANGDDSWITKKISATGELISDVGEGVTKGGIGAVVAGVNSILNTGIAIGNFLGADTAPIDTYNVLKGFDDDLGKYYKEHQEGVETAGFLLGALVPGMAGVKALQAAKAGWLGENMLRSSGLMKTLTADYATAAKGVYAAGNSPFSLIEANSLKALAQGFGSNILDAAAFNTAVTASMFASPMLKDESISDLFWNDVTGSLLWGGVGGVLTEVKNAFGVVKAGRTVKEMTLPQNFITKLPNEDNIDPILVVLNNFKNKFELPEAIGPLKVDAKVTGLSENDVMQIADANRIKTLERIEGNIRNSLNKFAGGDTKIGNALFEATKDATKFEDILQSLGPQARKATRISGDDSLAYGEVHFPIHGKGWEDFQNILAEGKYDELFSPKGGKEARGFRIVGDLAELRVTGAKNRSGFAPTVQAAWDAGYDVFRNPNGTVTINPESKILQRETRLPASNKILVDLEDASAVRFKATPGLADLATPTRDVILKGDTVMAGDLNPIKIGKSANYNPMDVTYLEAQARSIWAHNSDIPWGTFKVGENDLPILEKLYAEFPTHKPGTTLDSVYFTTGQPVPRGEVLRNLIEEKKANFAIEGNAKGIPVDELSLRLNATDKYLTEADSDGWMKIKKGVDYTQPRYAKIEYSGDVTNMPMLNPNNHTGAMEYARQVEAVKVRVKENFANFTKAMNDLFPDGVSPYDPRWKTASDGAGAGLASFANANYGTFGGWAQFVGSLTDKLLLERKTVTAKGLNASFAKLNQDSEGVTGAAKMAEAALINNRLLQSPDAWKFNPNNPSQLITKKDFHLLTAKDKNGNLINPGYEPDGIDIKSSDVADFYRTHSEFNGERQTHIANMKSSAGAGDDFDPSVIYPIPVDTKNLKHFVLVEPRAPISIADKKRIISAKDEATLQELIKQVDPNEYKIRTKAEAEQWHKDLGDYEFALGLNDSAVDSGLKREGLLSQHFPTINEGFFQRVEDWHMRQEELLTRSMVYHRYSQEFEELKHLGEKYTSLATSQFKYLSTTLEKSVQDPYNDIVRTALNVSRSSEYQPWVNFNTFVKDAIEKPINKLREVFKTQPKVNDEFVKTVSGIMEDMGQRPVFENTASIMIANKNIPDKPWLAPAIAKAQAVMSTTLLQWDSMNALNNVIGSAVLTAPEMSYIMKGIAEAKPEIAGKMAEYMKVTMPDGSGIAMPTIQRLIANAVKNQSAEDAIHLPLLQRYREIGTVTDLSLQARESFNHLLIDWSKVGQNEALSKIEKAADFGRKWSGNQRAEEFNRFVASDVMRQVTDFGIEAGILTEKEANEYIQIFVNRTQGNYLYSQRPIIFQGVVGQAVSLFQTYQFNLMQQLFRFVGEGESKTASMLLGLQGSIYGMQGLPAFNFLNTHIVGNAAGNTNHKDLYAASYSVFGKQLGDWMLYGAGSNALGLIDPSMKFNLYSRGDINPRQLTVLPTNISDIPIVAASTKFVGNLFAASEKIAQGGSFWPTLSQAIEHNGLSRPLTGLAQIAQGYTTTNSGSLLSSSQDFGSIATLTRLAGAKPFDEAVALDALYRINAYRAHDSKNIQELGSAIKTSLVAGGQPTSDQVTNFAKEYAKSGGKIENFNRFFSNELLNANRSQVNKVVTNLNSPFAKQMQQIMGGVQLQDFTNTPQ